jgi:hypothetical protein
MLQALSKTVHELIIFIYKQHLSRIFSLLSVQLTKYIKNIDKIYHTNTFYNSIFTNDYTCICIY